MPPVPTPAPRRRTVVLAAAGTVAAVSAVRARPVRAAEQATWINRVLRSMSVEQKVGQLFSTHVYGATADTADARNTAEYGVSTPAEILAKYHLGGVLYFAWSDNVQNPGQIAGLSNGLQRKALSAGPGVPLLISTDQEQGTIVRVGPPATQFPGNMALGAGRDPAAAREASAVTGAELRALGINQDFAPVADVNVNAANPVIGVRSFGSDPDLVADLTVAQVRGYQKDAHIAATVKHFPGHGDTETDSHTGIPVITHSREEWERVDAPPFQAAVAAGVDAVMTGHLVFPALDPSGDPATLSRPIITGILRADLGFDGLVVTDSLGMQGVRDKYGDDRVPVLALNAGVDMLLNPPAFDLAYQSVLAAVRSGEIARERLDEALTRILRLKYDNGIVAEPYVDENGVERIVGTPEHLATAARITDRTTTLIRNDAGLLPLKPGDRDVLVTGAGATATRTLAEEIARHGATCTVHVTGTRPADAAIEQAVAAAGTSDLVLVLTQKAWDTTVTDPEARQRRLVRELVGSGTPVVAVATHDAYDIASLSEAPTYLATYASNAVALGSLARVLFGEIAPTGKLPVTIPRADDPAAPLYEFGHGLTW